MKEFELNEDSIVDSNSDVAIKHNDFQMIDDFQNITSSDGGRATLTSGRSMDEQKGMQF